MTTNFESFRKEVEKELETRGLNGKELTLINVVKNRGSVPSMVLSKPISNISISIPLYGNEKVSEIADIWEDHLNGKIKIPFDENELSNQLNSREYVLNNIYPFLIDSEGNQEFLDICPSSPSVAEGLRVCYRICVGPSSYTKVTYPLLECLGLTLEDLEKYVKVDNPVFVSMNNFLKDFGIETETNSEFNMIIVSSEILGAAIINHVDFEEIQRRFGTFYMLPSSVYEWIMVVGTEFEPTELSEMVQSVNMTQLSPDEILSDCAFIYEGNKLIKYC